MNEKSIIDVRLNVAVPKRKQEPNGSKSYLHSQELSTAPLHPKFGVTSHFMSNCIIKTNSGNQTKHQFIKNVFDVAKIEKVLRCFIPSFDVK